MCRFFFSPIKSQHPQLGPGSKKALGCLELSCLEYLPTEVAHGSQCKELEALSSSVDLASCGKVAPVSTEYWQMLIALDLTHSGLKVAQLFI